MDGWYYKLFDSDFGPVVFEELVVLAKNRTLSREDQVRFGEQGPWRQAGSIGPLMAHFPFEAAEKVITMSPINPATESWEVSDADAAAPSMDDFVISESSLATKSKPVEVRPAAPKYVAPVHRPQLEEDAELNDIEFAEQVAVQIHSDDRHFDDRGAGVSRKAVIDRNTPVPRTQSAGRKQVQGRVEEAPPQQPSKDDARWWCMIQDKEYGPVDLPKLIDWAAAGRLHRNDHVRYGLEAYVRADDLPELFPKLPSQQMQDTKTEIETKTEIRPGANARPTPKPVNKPVEKSAPKAVDDSQPVRIVAEETVVAQPKPQPVAATVPTPAPAPEVNAEASPPPDPAPGAAPVQAAVTPSAGLTRGSSAPSRPPMPMRKMPAKSGASLDFKKLMKSPIALGGAGVLLLLIVVVPLFLFSTSPYAGKVKEMDAKFLALVKLRSNPEVNTDELKPVADQAGQIASKIVGELKDTTNKTAKKVLAAAKKLEELSKMDLSKSPADAKVTGIKRVSESEIKIAAAMSNANIAMNAAKKAVGL